MIKFNSEGFKAGSFLSYVCRRLKQRIYSRRYWCLAALLVFLLEMALFVWPVGWLKEVCAAQAVLDYAAAKVKAQVGKWSGGQLEAETVVFSSLHGVAGKTSQAEAFLCLWKGRI